MTARFSSRRILLVAALLAGLALAPRTEARVRRPEPAVAAARSPAGSGGIPGLAFFRHLLQSLRGKAGSSMDPLGNH